MTGSLQLRQFRTAIRYGHAVDAAAQIAGIGETEAHLTLAADRDDPPAPDAYRPIGRGFCATCGHVLCGHSDAEWAA